MKLTTEPFCLTNVVTSNINGTNEGSASTAQFTHWLKCPNENETLFILQKQYGNDYQNHCNNNDKWTSNRTNGSDRAIGTNIYSNKKKCFAYMTQQLADECNGKNACEIKIESKQERPSFNYGFLGSNCDFQAEILSITYECLMGNNNNNNIKFFLI